MESTRDETNHLIPLFVYGTLRSGGSNHWRMANASFFSAAITHGSLYCIDWYPGLVIDQSSSIVYGELYYCDELLLQKLDDFEGDIEYDRQKRIVKTPDGQEIEAFIWVYKKSIDTFTKITSGDWLLHYNRKS